MTRPSAAASLFPAGRPVTGRLLLPPVLLLAALFALVGCGGGDQAAPRPTPDHPAGARPQARPVTVATAPAVTGEIASWYRATASLEPEKQAVVPARVAGMVDSLLCEEGDLVSAGQLLLTLDNDEYLYRLRQAEAAAANLRARFQRLERMLQDDLVSDEEFMAARSDYEKAVADEGLARLNLSYTRVRAPFAGRITARRVDVGQYVTPGTELVTVADVQPLLARVHVPARQFRSLRVGQSVRLVLDSDRQALTGRIRLVSPVIDPQTGTIKVTVEVTDVPPDIRPGDFAEIRIETDRHTDTVLVPRSAVITDKTEQVVYVVRDARAERRVVTLGYLDDEHAEILDGVAAGEPVVVRGQRSLKPGSPVRVVPLNAVDSLLTGTDADTAAAGSAPSDTAGRGRAGHRGRGR